jgi:hypothetical protein
MVRIYLRQIPGSLNVYPAGMAQHFDMHEHWKHSAATLKDPFEFGRNSLYNIGQCGIYKFSKFGRMLLSTGAATLLLGLPGKRFTALSYVGCVGYHLAVKSEYLE